jgi:hypothetical protein
MCVVTFYQHMIFSYYIMSYKRNVLNRIMTISQKREKSDKSGLSGISTT